MTVAAKFSKKTTVQREWLRMQRKNGMRLRKECKNLYINPNAVSNHIQTIHMSNCGTVDWRNNDYDFCPSCMAKLNDWLKGEQK